MKKVVIGSSMILTGIVSITMIISAILITGAQTVDMDRNVLWLKHIYYLDIMPYVIFLVCVSVIGLLIALWGLSEKQNKNQE